MISAASLGVSQGSPLVVFTAAYSLRKLGDAAKMSTDRLAQDVEVRRFSTVNEVYSEVNDHQFDDYFDLKKPDKQQISLQGLLNILIHSLVFIEVLGDDYMVNGSMVTSDWESELPRHSPRCFKHLRTAGKGR